MKKIFTILTMAVLCLCAFNGNASAQIFGSTGYCTWMLTDSTLTISGTGAMGNYNSIYHAPWYSNWAYIKTVVIEDGVTSIGSYAFYGCSGLTSVSIGNSVTHIYEHAFYGCHGLTSVSIGNYVTSIGNYAFFNCSGLTSVSIGNSVTGIGDYAFYGCSGLTDIILEDCATTLPFGTSAFRNCPIGSLYLGRNISSSPFCEKTTLTTLTIGYSVTSIGYSVFSGCSGLTSVSIPNSVTSIGDYAFFNCIGLTSVSIPNSVTTIGHSAFSGCSGLTSVSIPNSVTSIDSKAFRFCRGLTDVTVYWATPLAISWHVFYYELILFDIKLHVPAGTKALYQAADVWKDFNITDVPAGIQGVSVQPLQVSVSGGELSIHSESPVRRVEIYSLSGSLVVEESNFAGKINVASLPAGVYFVKAGGKTGKFVKE